MAVGAFVNAEIEKRGTTVSERRASDILEKTKKYLQLYTPSPRSGPSADISVRQQINSGSNRIENGY